MKILVVGGGGREHALVWKLKQSPRVEEIWCAPGNGGLAAEAKCAAIDAGEVGAIVELAEKIRPDLTVVGPELPLVNGMTDAFRQRNWAIVGPSQQAAQLEGSKVFSKEFLERHRIPTAKLHGTYDSPSEVYRIEPPVVEQIINPIGCGDCLAAGMAWGLQQRQEPIEAVRLGIAAAAENLGGLLPARLTVDKVLARLGAIRAERIS